MTQEHLTRETNTEVACFAGGCFWGVEYFMEDLEKKGTTPYCHTYTKRF